MKKYIISSVLVLAVVLMVGFSSASAKAADISAMEQQLQLLMRQLQVLQSQLNPSTSGGAALNTGNQILKIPENSGLNGNPVVIQVPSTATPELGGGHSNIEYPVLNPGPSVSWCHTFNANLGMGSAGNEVSALETALNKEGLGSFTEAAYDDNLASAVSGFQEKYRSDILTPNGLNYGTGYVGASTRTKLNSLYGCNNSIVNNNSQPSITIISPNGGEALTVGQNYTISWQTKNLPIVNQNNWKISIQLRSKTSELGDGVSILSSPLSRDSASYNWQVSAYPGDPATGSQDLLRVCLYDSSSGGMYNSVQQYCADSSVFSIVPQSSATSTANPVINYFNASATTISSGGSVNFSWGGSNVSYYTLSARCATGISVISNKQQLCGSSSGESEGLNSADGAGFTNNSSASQSAIIYLTAWGVNGAYNAKSITINVNPQAANQSVSMMIDEPASNNQYYQGGQMFIDWWWLPSIANPPSQVNIQLWNGSSTSLIATAPSLKTNVTNAGSYYWTIPANQAPGNNYKVSVTLYGTNITAWSGVFTINSSAPALIPATTTTQSPSVTITSPVSAKYYAAGQILPIAWQSTGDTYGKVNIQLWQYYSTGGRGSGPAVTVSDNGSGTYNWALPADQPAGNYAVSITLWAQNVTGWTGQFGITAPSVATTTQAAPSLSVSLAPNNPPAQQIAMGTTNVVLASYQMTNTSNEAVTIQNLSITAGISGYYSPGSSLSNIFSNFRLMNGSTVVAYGLNLNSMDQLEWTNINYNIPQGGYVNLNIVADANTWSALQASGVEHSSDNPSIFVGSFKVGFIGVSSGIINSAQAPVGNTMQLLRTVIAPSTANVNLGVNYSANELVGAFTFSNVGTDPATPYAALNGIGVTLNLANSAAKNGVTTTISFADANNNILGSYQITIGTNWGYSLYSSWPSGIQGINIPAGGSLTIYVYANTSINGINVRPAGSNSQIIINSALTGYTWTDGTRTNIGSNPYPANLLPITSGNAIVASLTPENTALTASVLGQLTNILNQLAQLLK